MKLKPHGAFLSLKCATLQDWQMRPTPPGQAQKAKAALLPSVPHLLDHYCK